MSAPLKPCPFCGGEVHIDVSDDQTVATINCAKGSSCIVSGLLMGFMAKNKTSALAQWNARADAPELAALVDAAEQMRRAFIPFADEEFAAFYALDAALAAWEALVK